MSKPVYLYRAVTVRESLELPARFPLGRVTGYLSRSSAVEAGERSGLDYVVERSEPVVFLGRAEKLRRQIAELEAELAAVVPSE